MIGCSWSHDYATCVLCRLARNICMQIKERVSMAHSTFLAAVKRLDEQHTNRQERTEEQQLRVRKIFTPKIARLTLESTSLKDYIIYGTVGGQLLTCFHCGSQVIFLLRLIAFLLVY